MKNVNNNSKAVRDARTQGGKSLLNALISDGWVIEKKKINNKQQWLAVSPAGQEETNPSLKKILLNSSQHPMYQI